MDDENLFLGWRRSSCSAWASSLSQSRTAGPRSPLSQRQGGGAPVRPVVMDLTIRAGWRQGGHLESSAIMIRREAIVSSGYSTTCAGDFASTAPRHGPSPTPSRTGVRDPNALAEPDAVRPGPHARWARGPRRVPARRVIEDKDPIRTAAALNEDRRARWCRSTRHPGSGSYHQARTVAARRRPRSMSPPGRSAGIDEA